MGEGVLAEHDATLSAARVRSDFVRPPTIPARDADQVYQRDTNQVGQSHVGRPITHARSTRAIAPGSSRTFPESSL